MEFHSGEAKPDMGVEFLSLFVGVAGQIEDQNSAARLEDGKGALDCPLGTGCMMKCLTEENDID